MKLQTEISFFAKNTNSIDYDSKVFLIGSCFSENIGKRLDYFKFQNIQNPLGILFHPKAIEVLIENAIQNKIYSEKDVFFHNEQWHCYDSHSKLSNASKENLIDKLNLEVKSTREYLNSATHVIITLGTAWVYKLINIDKVVANCHKVPQKEFSKSLLSIEEVVASLKNILEQIRSVNYTANVIFTVSPIRHLKDGFVENTQSKAHLLSAIHSVVHSNSFYFPSFEIMMDELRDYRFYGEDMIHPNATAILYIWEKFQQVWIADHALKTMKDVDAVQKGINHKPFNENSEAHAKFLKNLDDKKTRLFAEFPNINF
jgi:hypothetical protein